MRMRRQDRITAVGEAMQAYQRSTDAYDDLVATRLGVNRTDLRCLDVLFSGPMATGELAEAVGLSTAATTSLVDRLEARRLVRRVRHTADRRKVLVEMTEEGVRLAGAFYAPLAAEGAALLKDYRTPELDVLRRFLVQSKELTDRHRARLRDAG